MSVEPPDLPALEPARLDDIDGRLVLDGVRVEQRDAEPVSVRRMQVTESELGGVTLQAAAIPGLALRDVVLRDCDLSNIDGREGLLRRVAICDSRLVGFGLSRGKAQDLRVVDSSLTLCSFASAELRNVVFERVNLEEATFMDARLDAVEFLDCRLAGADFRGVTVKACAIRGTLLEGVIGVECLAGVAMPVSDVIASATAIAEALGIRVEFD